MMGLEVLIMRAGRASNDDEMYLSHAAKGLINLLILCTMSLVC